MCGSGLTAPLVRFSVGADSLRSRASGRGGGESLAYSRPRVNRAAALLLGLAALFAAPAAGQDASAPGRETPGKLASDDAEGRAAMDALSKLGEPAALEALADLGRADAETIDVLGRRRRAHLAFLAGTARCIPPAIAALRDPDPGTRAELLLFLARDDLGSSGLTERVDTLAERALRDPDPALRARAIELLAGLDRDESLARLDALLEELEEPLRGKAAVLLAERPRARALVEKRLGSPGAPGLSDPVVLAPLLAALGRELGDRADARGAAPLLRALRDADPRIRRGAEAGLDAFVRRLYAGADAARAVKTIRELEDLGLDRAQGALMRARASLALGADPAAALAAAADLAGSAAAPGFGDREVDARATLALARQLEAAARLAAGSAAEAAGPLAEAIDLCEGLLAERDDRRGKALAAVHAARLHRRAQCELLAIVQALAASETARGPDAAMSFRDAVVGSCVRSARRVHALELEAQLVEAPTRAGGRASLDPMFEDDLSPVPLFLENPRLSAWPAERSLAMRRTLGRVLASVAHDEVPGFEPVADVPPEIADPCRDPERLALLGAGLRARTDAVSARRLELWSRVHAEEADDPTAPSDGEMTDLRIAEREWMDVVDERSRVSQGETKALLESRAPSLQGMALARALRDEGREADARALAEAVKKDLGESGDLKRLLLVEAEIEMTIGSTWIDSGDPPRAEVELARAVDRLESIETSLKDRGAPPSDLAIVRGLRASALVSMAVNANVKMGDPKKALGYFEKAFELRQDEFMRVLLACYRARSGRSEDARAILRGISPSPANLYNLACTWALLGEGELAFECLARDLEENPMSPGAREKQKEWARKDPDLRSLRDDPRFEKLLGK